MPSPQPGNPVAQDVFGGHSGVHAHEQSGSAQPTAPSPSVSTSVQSSYAVSASQRNRQVSPNPATGSLKPGSKWSPPPNMITPAPSGADAIAARRRALPFV